MADIKHITKDNFNELVIDSKTPVLVDFFATWCGPCKMLSPIIEQVADEVERKVVIAKLDIDECMEIAQEYGIMSVPTLVLFKEGAEVTRSIGFRGKPQILDMINSKL